MAFHSRWASAIRGSWICSLRAGSSIIARALANEAGYRIGELASEAASPRDSIIQEVYS